MSDSFAVNKARWDEVVEIHARAPFYRVAEFLRGEDTRYPIERRELSEVRGRRLLHLQCHFGLDTLCLARLGARVTGLDFAPSAIGKARELAAEAGIEAHFVEGNVYDAPRLIGERFDLVYVTWGAICWLPDIAGWARIVAEMLEPGGFLYLLEGHPFALALDQPTSEAPLQPTFDYFQGGAPLIFQDETTYADPIFRVVNREAHEWNHPLSAILNALGAAGLRLDWLHEHDCIAWQLYKCLQEGADRMFRLAAGRPSLPLSFSLKATRERAAPAQSA